MFQKTKVISRVSKWNVKTWNTKKKQLENVGTMGQSIHVISNWAWSHSFRLHRFQWSDIYLFNHFWAALSMFMRTAFSWHVDLMFRGWRRLQHGLYFSWTSCPNQSLGLWEQTSRLSSQSVWHSLRSLAPSDFGGSSFRRSWRLRSFHLQHWQNLYETFLQSLLDVFWPSDLWSGTAPPYLCRAGAAPAGPLQLDPAAGGAAGSSEAERQPKSHSEGSSGVGGELTGYHPKCLLCPRLYTDLLVFWGH